MPNQGRNRVIEELVKIRVELTGIKALLSAQGGMFMATMQEILDEVTAESTVADSVLAIVQRLVNEQDPAARQAILDGLKANRSKLDAAVVAGTPAA